MLSEACPDRIDGWDEGSPLSLVGVTAEKCIRPLVF